MPITEHRMPIYGNVFMEGIMKNNFPIFKNLTGQTSQTGLTCPTCLTLPNGDIIFRAFLSSFLLPTNRFGLPISSDSGYCIFDPYCVDIEILSPIAIRCNSHI